MSSARPTASVQLRDTAGGVYRRNPPQASVQLEIGAAAQRRVENRVLEHRAAHAASQQRLSGHVVASQTGAARGGRHRRGQHPDRGRLPRPVGPQKAEHLTRRCLKSISLHRFHPARIGLDQPCHFHSGPPCGVSEPVDADQRGTALRGPGSGMSLRFNLFICHLSVLAYLADCMTIQ